jgi:hypothetical protein
MARPRTADAFATIRARIEELRRERSPAPPSEEDPRWTGRLPRSPDDGDGRSAGSERGRQEERGEWSRGSPRRHASRANKGADSMAPNGRAVLRARGVCMHGSRFRGRSLA